MILSNGFFRQRAIATGTLWMLFVFFSVSSTGGETLWNPDFGGYISDGSGFKVGTTLSVIVTPSTRLTLTSSHIDSTEGRLNFSGGKGEGLFDFLPEASGSSSFNLEEESSYTLETSVTARVTRRGEDGLYFLEGRRSILLNSNRETLRISGWFSPDGVSSEGTLAFDMLHEAELEYISPGLAREDVLSPEDLTEKQEGRAIPETTPQEAQLSEGQDTGEVVEGETRGTESPEVEDDGTIPLSLTAEKQEELLIRYFNRFIRSFFSP